jgi:hypothetical protein
MSDDLIIGPFISDYIVVLLEMLAEKGVEIDKSDYIDRVCEHYRKVEDGFLGGRPEVTRHLVAVKNNNDGG